MNEALISILDTNKYDDEDDDDDNLLRLINWLRIGFSNIYSYSHCLLLFKSAIFLLPFQPLTSLIVFLLLRKLQYEILVTQIP